eukprot:m.158842 g.158842  ORF g.158842 m.158842 type:complete len:609 (+) comp38755_c0_seq1:692-2518(+)
MQLQERRRKHCVVELLLFYRRILYTHAHMYCSQVLDRSVSVQCQFEMVSKKTKPTSQWRLMLLGPAAGRWPSATLGVLSDCTREIILPLPLPLSLSQATSFSQGLFRNHGDVVLTAFKPHLQRLCADKQDSSQRCAAEITAGLVRGSKHWPFVKVRSLWEFLLPCLVSVLNEINVETFSDWGTCFASCSANRDPRRLHWLFELLFRLRLDEGKGSFKDTAQLCLLQAALEQQEWRVPALHHALLEQLKPNLSHPYKLVRDRIGSLLSTIFLFEVELPNGGTRFGPKLSDFVEFVVPHLELIPEKGEDMPDGPLIEMAASASLREETSNNLQETDTLHGSAKERADESLQLFKTVLNWLLGHSRGIQPLQPPIFRLLPYVLFCESHEDDKELETLSKTALSCISNASLPGKSVEVALQAIERVLQGSSWKAICAALKFLSTLVLRNIFIVRKEASVSRIEDMVVHLLQNQRLEVRECSSAILSKLLQCGFIALSSRLIGFFNRLASIKLSKGKEKKSQGAALVKRHGGVLGLCACVNAFPQSIPEPIPDVLMTLANHVHDPVPIQETAKKTVANFKDNHRDDWDFHRKHFTEEQLTTLSGLLISPNYYV